MKKTISILLISLILLQTSEASIGDILQLKNLYKHAKFHQEAYGDDFFDFFSEHYGDEMQTHQNEHPEHENLPLKHQHNCIDTTITAVTHACYSINEQSRLQIPVNFFYTESTSVFEKPSVFQPPQFA